VLWLLWKAFQDAFQSSQSNLGNTWSALTALESILGCSGELWWPVKHQIYPGHLRYKRAFPDELCSP